MTEITQHNITKIQILPIRKDKIDDRVYFPRKDDRVYFSRKIIITSDEGEIELILFSDNRTGLIISDENTEVL